MVDGEFGPNLEELDSFIASMLKISTELGTEWLQNLNGSEGTWSPESDAIAIEHHREDAVRQARMRAANAVNPTIDILRLGMAKLAGDAAEAIVLRDVLPPETLDEMIKEWNAVIEIINRAGE